MRNSYPTLRAVALLALLGGASELSYGQALPQSCVSVAGSFDQQQNTLMVYTNNCDADCVSFIPYARGPGGAGEVGVWNIGVQFAQGGRILLGRGEQATASWGRKTGTWSGFAQNVVKCTP